MTLPRWVLLSLLLSVMLFLGCSSSKKQQTIHGKVTYRGEGVPAGTVTFYRTGENQSGAYPFSLKTDGTYTGSGLPPEEMIVTIDTESANPNRKTPSYGPKGKEDYSAKYQKMMKDKAPANVAPESTGKYVSIPKKYADKAASPLRADLKSGKAEFDFDLKD